MCCPGRELKDLMEQSYGMVAAKARVSEARTGKGSDAGACPQAEEQQAAERDVSHLPWQSSAAVSAAVRWASRPPWEGRMPSRQPADAGATL